MFSDTLFKLLKLYNLSNRIASYIIKKIGWSVVISWHLRWGSHGWIDTTTTPNRKLQSQPSLVSTDSFSLEHYDRRFSKADDPGNHMRVYFTCFLTVDTRYMDSSAIAVLTPNTRLQLPWSSIIDSKCYGGKLQFSTGTNLSVGNFYTQRFIQSLRRI